MNRVLPTVLVLCVLAESSSVGAQQGADSEQRLSLGVNEYLSAGADAIRAGEYDDGIRLTLRGLEIEPPGTRNRAAGLANLCAAHVANNEVDRALPYCDEALRLNAENWRALSNRSRAYFIKGLLEQAAADNAAAAALAPNAAHVAMMRELLNERLLKPTVIVEEH